jgi:hypothetical protein
MVPRVRLNCWKTGRKWLDLRLIPAEKHGEIFDGFEQVEHEKHFALTEPLENEARG